MLNGRRSTVGKSIAHLATAVSGFAEILRGSKYAEGISLALIEELARGATSRDQADRLEFITLVQKAWKLKKG